MKDSHTITILEDGLDGTAIILKLVDYNTYSGEMIFVSPEGLQKIKEGMSPKDISEEDWFRIPIEPSDSQCY